MYFIHSFVLVLIFSLSASADENTNTLEAVLLTEGASVTTEIQNSLNTCKSSDQIQTKREENEGTVTIAFSCRLPEHEILTSEVLISTEDGAPKLAGYQEMKFEEKEIPPSVMLSMDPVQMESVSYTDDVSPGVSTLLTLAKVGIPVALSFKTAKVIAPTRTDWQKHFIAGAIISGVTVLTTEGLLRTFFRNRGVQLSETKITLISSLAGLLMSVVAGASKELIYDKYLGLGTPDINDALHTVEGGAMVSITFAIPLDFLFRHRRSAVSIHVI